MKALICSSCGASSWKEENEYRICLHCGTKFEKILEKQKSVWTGNSKMDIGQALSDSLVKIRRQALKELKEAAYDLGCNAVIGAFEANYIVVAPIVSEEPGRIVYGEGKVLADEGIVRLQTDVAKKTPICCFRAVDDSELTCIAGETVYSLGNTVDRIKQEFHHDAFVLIGFDPFIDRVRKLHCFRLAGNVIYQDLLNDYPYEIDETNREIMEQLFRKDEKYAWQKEFRIILRPDENEKKLVDIGSLADISVYGRIDELKQGIQIQDVCPEPLR